MNLRDVLAIDSISELAKQRLLRRYGQIPHFPPDCSIIAKNIVPTAYIEHQRRSRADSSFGLMAV